MAIAVYVFKGQVGEVVTKKMTEGMENYDQGEEFQGVTDTWDLVQNEYECCGVNNYTDWQGTDFSEEGNIPDSCCRKESEGCGKDYFNEGDTKDIYTEGCLQKLETEVYDNIELVGGIALCVIFIQVCRSLSNVKMYFNFKSCLSSRSFWCWCPACWPTT